MLFVTMFGLSLLVALLLYGVLKEGDIPRKIPLLVTEDAANTFTTTQILLPNVKGETVFDLDKVQLNLKPIIPAAVDDWGEYTVQIVRDTGTVPTAILSVEDSRVLYHAVVRTTSGTEAADLIFIDRDEIGKNHLGYAEYIANDSLYMSVLGDAQAVATVVAGWMIGSVEKLTALQVMALLTSQLN